MWKFFCRYFVESALRDTNILQVTNCSINIYLYCFIKSNFSQGVFLSSLLTLSFSFRYSSILDTPFRSCLSHRSSQGLGFNVTYNNLILNEMYNIIYKIALKSAKLNLFLFSRVVGPRNRHFVCNSYLTAFRQVHYFAWRLSYYGKNGSW